MCVAEAGEPAEQKSRDAHARRRVAAHDAKPGPAGGDTRARRVDGPPPTSARLPDAARLAWHAAPGLVTVMLYGCFFRGVAARGGLGARATVVAVYLSPMLGLACAVEAARFRWAAVNAAFVRCLGVVLRDDERRGKRVNSSVWYLLSVVTALVVFPVDVAVVAVCYLAFCDPAASVCGRLWGHRTPRLLGGTKTVAGSAGAVATGAAITAAGYGALFAPHVIVGAWQLAVLSMLGGIAAAAAELVGDRCFVDDNLSIPLAAGAALWAARLALVAPAA